MEDKAWVCNSWENAVEIRRAKCDHCNNKDCKAKYDPDKPCPKDLK
jgi:hypothetical protein